ncbi:WD40 repeat-like protein [Atractiella rhizophila]|nr:WD40 repeat-like protein [Atractiella rhizophila]
MSNPTPSRTSARKPVTTITTLLNTHISKWPTRRIQGHRGMVQCLAWSCNGQNLATGANDKTIRCYNPERVETTSTEFRGHASNVNTVSFHPSNPQFFASGSADKTVKFWDLRQSKPVGSINVERTPLYMAFRPNSENLVIGDDNDRLQFMDFREYKIVRSWQPKESKAQVNEFRFAPSGRALIIAHGDHRASIYEYETMKEMHDLLCHTGRYVCMDIDPSGRTMAIGAHDALVSIWDTKDWICTATYAEFDQSVTSVSLSYDGKYCAATTEGDNRFEIFDTSNGKQVHQVSPADGHVQALAFCPTKPYLAYAKKGTPEGMVSVLGLDR